MSTYTPTGASQPIQLDKNNNFIDPVTGELMHIMTVDEMPRHTFGAELYAPDAVRPTAYWQGEYDGYADGNPVYDIWNCSACGYCIDDGTDDPDMLPKYCPKCGARMIKNDKGW